MPTTKHTFTQNGNALLIAVVTTTVILSVGASVMVSRSQWQMGNSKVAARSLMETSADAESKSVQRRLENVLGNATTITAESVGVPTGSTVGVSLANGAQKDLYERSQSKVVMSTGTESGNVEIASIWTPRQQNEAVGTISPVGRDDPYAQIANRKAYMAFVSSFTPTTSNTAAAQASSSLTQIIKVTFRTFPATAWTLLDRRGKDFDLEVPPQSYSQLGKCGAYRSMPFVGHVYTSGAFVPSSATYFRAPLVALEGLSRPGADLESSARLVFDLAGFYGIDTAGITHGDEGYVNVSTASGKPSSVMIPSEYGSVWPPAADWAADIAKLKQTNYRGALVSADDKIRPLQTAKPVLGDLIAHLSARTSLSLKLGNRAAEGMPVDYGILLTDGISSRGGVAFSASSAVLATHSDNLEEQSTITVDIGKLISAGTPVTSVYLDATDSSMDGVNVVIKNSDIVETDPITSLPVDGTIKNGITVISHRPLTISGNYGSYSSSGKNLIIAPSIGVLGASDQSQVNVCSSFVTNAAGPFQALRTTGYGELGHVYIVNVYGSLAIWNHSDSVGYTAALVLAGDPDLDSGAKSPHLTPAVTDIRIGDIVRQSGVFQAPEAPEETQ